MAGRRSLRARDAALEPPIPTPGAGDPKNLARRDRWGQPCHRRFCDPRPGSRDVLERDSADLRGIVDCVRLGDALAASLGAG
jgi:hypothetical protein